MRDKVVVLCLGFVLLCGCATAPDQREDRASEAAPTTGGIDDASRLTRAAAPSRITYRVADRIRQTKLSLEVSLLEPLPEGDLLKFANNLYDEHRGRTYARVFMTYRLPGTQASAAAWATTHWNPELKIKILGLPVGVAKKLIEESRTPPGSKVLGRWVHRAPPVSRVITIYLDGDQCRVLVRFKEGSSMTHVLESSDDRFLVTGNSYGEFYRIVEEGLQIHDRDGLIGTARPWR